MDQDTLMLIGVFIFLLWLSHQKDLWMSIVAGIVYTFIFQAITSYMPLEWIGIHLNGDMSILNWGVFPAIFYLMSKIPLNPFCRRHDWYISDIFPLGNGETQVYIRCRKCGAFEENSGKASPTQMLRYEKQTNGCGCPGKNK